ncbi:MAG: hypothetical protein MHMPM18_001351 [Marteilia pararefringens]
MLCVQKSFIFPNICKLLFRFYLLNLSVILKFVSTALSTSHLLSSSDQNDQFLNELSEDYEEILENDRSIKSDHNSEIFEYGSTSSDLLKQWCYIIIICTFGSKHRNSKKPSFLQKIYDILKLHLSCNSQLLETDEDIPDEGDSIKESLDQSPMSLALFYITKQKVTDMHLVCLLKTLAHKYHYSFTTPENLTNGQIKDSVSLNSFKQIDELEGTMLLNNSVNGNQNLTNHIIEPIKLSSSLTDYRINDSNSLLPEHLIPLSDVFIHSLNLIGNLEHQHDKSIYILTSVLDTLDNLKTENKTAREAILFINSAFNQDNTTLVPEKSQFRDNYAKIRHRDRYYIELSDACNYADFLMKNQYNDANESSQAFVLASDIAIIVPENILKDEIYFDLINTIKAKGIVVSEMGNMTS